MVTVMGTATVSQPHDGMGAPLASPRLEIFKLALGRSTARALQGLENSRLESVIGAIESTAESSEQEDSIKRAKLADVVADVVDDDIGLAAQILSDPRVTSPRDVALHYGLQRMVKLCSRERHPSFASPPSARGAGEGAGLPAVPEPAAESAKAMARKFRRRLFSLEPTAVFQQMVASEDEEENPSEGLAVHESPEVRLEVARFLHRRPDFNIRTCSVLEAAREELPEEKCLDSKTRTDVIQGLQVLQRVQGLTPTPEALKPLVDNGMTSAARVSSLPRKQFLQYMVPKLADSTDSKEEAVALATSIHDHAMVSRLNADHTLVQLHQLIRGSGLTAIDGNSSLADRRNAVQKRVRDVNLDVLFADMDFCECEACLDVTSPTAYFVDLLEYLRHNNLDRDVISSWTAPEGYAGTALESLLIRRPDLQHLKLTCENANTVLPMIDLVNEVMESFIIHLKEYSLEWTSTKQTIVDAWNITDETPEELAASPSNTQRKAYSILNAAVFPIATLPYSQPLHAMRLYLEFLKTSRFELIDTFRLARRQWDVDDAFLGTPEKIDKYEALMSQVQDRAAAAEYLGINPDEYVIATREGLWPRECWEFQDGGEVIDVETYQDTIGVRPAHRYWGYSMADSVLSMDAQKKAGLSFVKAQFLPRSGLSYVETVDLVRTHYVNPMMPTGRERIILESVRFSYRYLRRLADAWDTVSTRQQFIIRFLISTQKWARAIALQQYPPTGNQLIEADSPLPELSVSDIRTFVTKWFDCIGKLVVLDAGASPVFSSPGYLVYHPVPVIEKSPPGGGQTTTGQKGRESEEGIVLGYIDETGQWHNQEGELLGFVTWDSRLLLIKDSQPIREVYNNLDRDIQLINIVPQQSNPVTYVWVLQNRPVSGHVYVNDESYFTSESGAGYRWEMPADTCSIEDTKLQHLDGTPLELWEWDRINRFIRLYAKVQTGGWTISQLDVAIKALWKVPETLPTPSDEEGQAAEEDELSPCDRARYPEITPGFLKELMSVRKLSNLTSIDLDKLLVLWSDLNTHGDNSLYARLFLSHDLKCLDPVFQSDENGDYLADSPTIESHVPVLVAALRLKADVFDKVCDKIGLQMSDPITTANLSKLYRHVLLSSILGIKPQALADSLDLFPNPYESAAKTLEMCRLWTRMSGASFTATQLRYITLGQDDALRSIALDRVKMLKTIKTIIEGLTSIDVTQPDLTVMEEADLTAKQVKEKALLMFSSPVVDDILGLIEGTRVYKTNAPAGLVIDPEANLNVSPKIIYKDADDTASSGATLSIVGILSPAEMDSAEDLFPDNQGWKNALARLRNQSQKLVRETLSPLFPDDLDEAVQELARGDVAATPPTDTDPGDPGTAIVKRIYFLGHFMPFLRSYLATQLIVTTMSGVASLSQEACQWLLGDVIKVPGQSSGAWVSAMQLLRSVRDHASDGSDATWQGFIVPRSTDSYIFSGYGMGEDHPPPLFIGGRKVEFSNRNDDPSDLWFTGPVSLVGGDVVESRVDHRVLSRTLQWKTERSGFTTVPPTSLLPDVSAPIEEVFAKLVKASMVIQGFELEHAEVVYFQANGGVFGDLDFGNISFEAWKRLLAYSELRKSIPEREMTLIDLFKWASDKETATPGQIRQKIISTTAFDEPSLKVLMAQDILNLNHISMFRNEVALSKLSSVFQLMEKMGVGDVRVLIKLADLKAKFGDAWNLAQRLRQTIRGKYSAQDYETGIKPTHDRLRQSQRDALVAFLLVQSPIKKWGVSDAEGLFEFFLLDVKMGPCMDTSRLKQAISSVQLFVQRCMLGLEEKYGVANDALDAKRWEWMSKQTVWSANRKVFLWPENWVFPSVRDDKTPLYEELEGKLLEQDLNPANIMTGFQDYVSGLAGLYIEEEDNNDRVIHCVARTMQAPYQYFYRKYLDASSTSEWTPWIKIDAEIPTYVYEWGRTTATSFAENASPEEQEESVTAQEVDRGKQSIYLGSYVTPVAWRSRTFVFIGETTKQTSPNQITVKMTFKDAFEKKPFVFGPLYFWEVKLSWTELRNGEWTPKQTTAQSFVTWPTPLTDPKHLAEADKFQFMPRIVQADPDLGIDEHIRIEAFVYVHARETLVNLGNFVFYGSVVELGQDVGPAAAELPEDWRGTSFGVVSGRNVKCQVRSLQLSSDGRRMTYFKQPPYVQYRETAPHGIFVYRDGDGGQHRFYHPFSSTLLTSASRASEDAGIEPIMDDFRSIPRALWKREAFGIRQDVSDQGADDQTYPKFSELSSPYSNYNWELGFHGPVQVADALLNSQQFDKALNMLHHVFNPYADGTSIRRVWRWWPFQKASSEQVLETILKELRPRRANTEITQWRDKPFRPHVVARGRVVAYMKWTVCLYIKTLIAYGDYYFRRRTLEDIPRAIQLYVLASHLYGPKGQQIPRRGSRVPQTYFSLLDKWDAFSNALVQLEVAFPFSNQTDLQRVPIQPAEWRNEQEMAMANIFGFATSSYFCLPNNPELQQLRATIDQRLFNIRNCLDIDGKPMPLALWEPPLDPGALVGSVAGGLSLSSALNDLNASLANYRFEGLLARALEATAELKSLERAFLSAKEKRDFESLRRLRRAHEYSIQQVILDMKKAQLEEHEKALYAMEASQESPKIRHAYFSKQAGVEAPTLGSSKDKFKLIDLPIDMPTTSGDVRMSKEEVEEAAKREISRRLHIKANYVEIAAGILNALPDVGTLTAPFGAGAKIDWGPQWLGKAKEAASRALEILAIIESLRGGQAAKKGEQKVKFQERVIEANLAGQEFEHLNALIGKQQVRIQLAKTDIKRQEVLLENSSEEGDFLESKYTNDDLYGYVETTTRQSMYQTYLLAYDLAKKAELSFRFNRRIPASQAADFVSFGYFDPRRDGLLSSQQLYLALKRMEAAYQTERGYDYELSKSFSLRQTNPYALMALRETGACKMDIPEVLFDMDFPGHFFRRIKAVWVTIDCDKGPYTNVSATLRLLKHQYRHDTAASSSGDYVEDTTSGQLDARFQTGFVPIDSIATSSGVRDSGTHEVSGRSERYLPFEGAGAISTWEIQMPPNSFRPFDYTTISDVVLTMRYTACDGGQSLRKVAAAGVTDFINGSIEGESLMTMWDVRADFPQSWEQAFGSSTQQSGEETKVVLLQDLPSLLPTFAAVWPRKVQATEICVVTSLTVKAADIIIDFKNDGESANPFDEEPNEGQPSAGAALRKFVVSGIAEEFGDWRLNIKIPGGTELEGTERMWMIVRFKLG